MFKTIFPFLILGLSLIAIAFVALVPVKPRVSTNQQKVTTAESIPDEESSSAPLIVDAPGDFLPTGMSWIPGGEFIRGVETFPEPIKSDNNPDKVKPDEYPAHRVAVDGFFIDQTEVTNAEFKRFIDATGYVTTEEIKPRREDFIGQVPDVSLIPEENLVAGSICFNEKFNRDTLIRDVPMWEYQVWEYRPGACWKHPEGPDSDITDRMDHPVVHITFKDALAYCQWAGKRLPSEAEWELAARGGHQDWKYPWGNELLPGGEYRCNYWQGEFPMENTYADGFKGTSPVKSFPPNPYGLYDMAGNVWEFTADYYHRNYYSMSPVRNPQGPESSFDPEEPHIIKRVTRGGSFMCNTNSCTGYRVGARMRADQDSSAFHQGFRCVVDSTMVQAYQTAAKQKP